MELKVGIVGDDRATLGIAQRRVHGMLLTDVVHELDQRHSLVPRRERAQPLGAAVGAAVVDEDQLEAIGRLLQPPHDFTMATVDAIDFVEDGDDNGYLSPGWRGPSGDSLCQLGGYH